jgi:hypothetical protein
MMCMSRLDHAKGIPDSIVDASVMPLNELEKPVLHHVPFKTRKAFPRQSGVTLENAKRLRTQKRVFGYMNRGTLGSKLREKTVALTFEAAFEEALRA